MGHRGCQSLLVDHASFVLLALDELVDVVDENHGHHLLEVLDPDEGHFVDAVL